MYRGNLSKTPHILNLGTSKDDRSAPHFGPCTHREELALHTIAEMSKLWLRKKIVPKRN
jgi:hypothetical protein